MNKLKNLAKIFTQALVKENPLLVLMIGLCSSLAVTTSLKNGLGMGLSMTFVLVASELVISLFKKLIPSSVRIPVFIIVIAAFTTIIDYVLQAYFPELSTSMGVFIPLIVVNCIIMGRVEAFASKRSLPEALADGLGMGLGYTWVLAGISIVREILGAGSIFDVGLISSLFSIVNLEFQPILFFALPPGGFLIFAIFISFGLKLKSRQMLSSVIEKR